MGPAGAGKSMQGHKLADEYGFAYISTGEIFRLLITGRRRAEMLEGKLLSDAETIHVVDKVLDIIDTKEQFILDGFPRTQNQVTWMLGEVAAGRFEKPVVLHLTISEEEIRSRLTKRGRPDDTEAAVTQRFKSYLEETQPILQRLSENEVTVVEIDGVGSPIAIHDKIVKSLGL
ncbi:MAG: nucleoside monophosphate kinase [Candidatus Saccharimonadales bacterium]